MNAVLARPRRFKAGQDAPLSLRENRADLFSLLHQIKVVALIVALDSLSWNDMFRRRCLLAVRPCVVAANVPNPDQLLYGSCSLGTAGVMAASKRVVLSQNEEACS